jgi:predicted ATPase
MINRVDLRNFKCFDRLSLPLADLTVLSGTNASGKSSVLQVLALLHQTMFEHEWSNRLLLNGKTIRLGTVGDVVDKVHGRRSMEIGISDDELNYLWLFSGDERSEMSMAVDSVSVNDKVLKSKELQYLLPRELQWLLPQKQSENFACRLRRLTYIAAERIGPREFYSLDETATVVGPAGEHVVSVLHLGRDERVLDELIVEGVAPTRLRQVEARMRQFFPGCGLLVQQVPQANAVTLGLRTSDDSDFYRPIHVGFGLTQVLPIVVAALSASKGDILLIENPEVHLHPAGQATMGQFLGEVVSAGVQVVFETHSDHVLNGVRRSVKNGVLKPEQVALHFFRQRAKDMPQVVSPQLDKDGAIDCWPDGFFDQFDKDADYFAGWGN